MRKQVSVNENGSVGTLARGLDVLELFGQREPELSQKQISDRLALPMPTVHRLAAVLTERGWLDRDPITRRLRLGIEMARLVPAMMAGMRLPELARPHLLRLAVRAAGDRQRRDPRGPGDRLPAQRVRQPAADVQVFVGTRLPAHCTALGKCLLSQLPEDVAARGARPGAVRAAHRADA